MSLLCEELETLEKWLADCCHDCEDCVTVHEQEEYWGDLVRRSVKECEPGDGNCAKQQEIAVCEERIEELRKEIDAFED